MHTKGQECALKGRLLLSWPACLGLSLNVCFVDRGAWKGAAVDADPASLSVSNTPYTCMQATADYAYGSGGFAAWGIMPDSPLNFEIEVLSVQ
jgi:hypothetical protein